ncbi:hypothetical protein ASE04_22175 [Rhizobium sp. Root708]|nr:hypothetical protein ASE04_22175 [Rhizobium sp. Root708]
MDFGRETVLFAGAVELGEDCRLQVDAGSDGAENSTVDDIAKLFGKVLDGIARAAPAVPLALKLLDDVLSFSTLTAQLIAPQRQVGLLIRAPFLLALDVGALQVGDRKPNHIDLG